MSAERAAHCSDSDLVAYLDGELAWWRRFRVRRHLKVCWRCRSRAHDQQEQIFQLAARMEAWEYPGRFWHLDQRLKLGRNLRRFEALHGVPPRRIDRRWLIAAGAMAALALATLLWTPRQVRRSAPDAPVEALAAARTFEQQLFQRSVEQTLAVEIEPVRARRSGASRLEIWSDATGGRFASRWTAADGHLKQALWRPAPGREYLLQPHLSNALLHQPGHTGSDQMADFVVSGISGDLEDAFMRWMESRSWTPVSFVHEAGQWMSDTRATRHAERFVGSDGARQIRILVERHMHGGLARLTADFDSATFQPRSMAIRFEAGGRIAELKMITQRVRSIPAAEVAAAAESIPEAPVVPAPVPDTRRLPAQPTLAPPVDSTLADAAERAADAQFVLHTAGACLGEPVVIEEIPGGVRVRRVRGRSGTWPEATSSLTNLRDVLGALADLRDQLGVGPAAEDLTGPQQAVAHARALEALGQLFPARLAVALPERSRRVLDRMLRDHVEGVRSALGGLPAPPPEHTPLPAQDWREASRLLYVTLSNSGGASTERVGELLQAVSEGFASETRRSVEHARIEPGRQN